MTANRMLYLSFAVITLAGIWLTGFDRVHWLPLCASCFRRFCGLDGILRQSLVVEEAWI